MEKKEHIVKLYEEYIEQNMVPTEEYLKKAKRFSNAIEKFSEKITTKQNEELNKVYEYMNDMINEQCKQVFLEGYCLGVNLTTEALINKKT